MHDTRSSSLFHDALDIPAWLKSDRDRPFEERLHRDRTIAAGLPGSDPVARVRGWWAVVQRQLSPPARDGRFAIRLSRGRAVVTFLMLLLGALFGASTSMALFRYDGTWPVNVMTVLACLVLPQILLIALTVVLMLPPISGVRALQGFLGGLNPGAIIAALYRRVVRVNDEQASLLVWHEARGPAASRFARWQMLFWSQAAAFAFNVAAVVTALGLIAFTDLAFGWSTTLRLHGDDVLRLTQLLAAPWRELWPEAMPTADLIERSQFFRLAVSTPRTIAAAELTGWWPFLLAAIITYGVLPRCCLLVFTAVRLRSATRNLLMDDSHVRALLDRMNAAEVQLGSNTPEPAPAFGNREAQSAPAMAGDAMAIVWSGALPVDGVADWMAKHLRWRVTESLEAGNRSMKADQAVIERIAAELPAAVLICVRGWEAPLLELQDFIHELRARLGSKCSLIVVPIGTDGQVASRAEQSIWSRWTARVGDPALYLEAGT